MTRHPRAAGAARLAGTLVTLAAGEAALAVAGQRLPPLAPGDAGLSRTLEEVEPVLVATSALRLVALAVGAGLLALTAAGAGARALGATRLVLRLDRCTPPSLRRVLDGALGAGLAACIGLSSLPAGADPAPPPATTLRRIADEQPRPTPQPSGTTTLRRLPDAAAEGAGPAPDSPTARPGLTLPPAPAKPAAPHREVVVRPGDSFWRLAERHQAQRLGRHPSDAEVVACWTQLVDLNRHRLVVAGNADLLFPGQFLLLPCP